MKPFATAVPVPLALVAVAAALFAAPAASGNPANPVSRVVALLQALQTRLEDEFKAEESAFKKFVCWHQTVVAAKLNAISQAQSRINSLQVYVQEIEAGKYTFTTERADLEKQIGDLQQDLEAAATLRAEGNKDYKAANAEMEKAVQALDDAIDVLEAAAPAALLARKGGAGLLGVRRSLRKVLELGRGLFGKDDVQLLSRALGGDVPTWDWKKLNRKATFKTKYTSRTQEIISLLRKMRTTFAENLSESAAQEASAQTSYEKLKASKETMKSSSEDALVALVKENGARGLTKTEAQEEIQALQEQVTADSNFISDVNSQINTKSQQWNQRASLRQRELAAISEALAELHSDDARDLFRESFRSQGYSLFQESDVAGQDVQRHGWRFGAVAVRGRLAAASSELGALAAASGDARALALLACSANSSLAQVIVKIDALVATLVAEETTDLNNKEDCEAKRAELTQQARMTSLAMDSLSEETVRANEETKEMTAQIEEQEQVISDLNESLKELTQQRETEARQHQEGMLVDDHAAKTIQGAYDAIFEMKQQFPGASLLVQDRPPVTAAAAAHPQAAGRPGARLVAVERRASHQSQTAASGQQPWEVEAGAPPPPPPATWEDPTYKGSKGETAGILSILMLIKEDIVQDMRLATEAEEAAQRAYETQKSDLEKGKEAAQQAIAKYQIVEAAAEQEAIDKTAERTTKKGELDATMDEIKALQPGCNFLLVNFEIRTKKRQIELDGLRKAKAILQGARFQA